MALAKPIPPIEMHLAVKNVLEFIQSIEVPEQEHPWLTERLFYEQMNPLAVEKEPVFSIENKSVVSPVKVPIRIYRPSAEKNLPLILYMHGGWFKGGSLDTHDAPLRQLANLSQAVIIAIGYRLAPEHPFPAGFEDCKAVAEWALATEGLDIDKGNITVMGDSAGGALATAIANSYPDVFARQVLIYPATDPSLSSNSWQLYKNGPILNIEEAKRAWSYYLPGENHLDNPNAVPLKTKTVPGLPPTFIATAQYDPLRDEALAYANILMDNGIVLTQKTYCGMVHGFFQMGAYLSAAKELMLDMVQFMQKGRANSETLRKEKVLRYFRKIDAGEFDEEYFDLFTEEVELYFPKYGFAKGKEGIKNFGQSLGKSLNSIHHDIANFRIMVSGNHIIVEGTESGLSAWPDRELSQGKFCNVFEFEGNKISRVHIYVDPDFTSEDQKRVKLLKGPAKH